MTSVFFYSPSNNHSSYSTDHYDQHNHQFLSTNYHQPPSSSSTYSLTTHLFLNSNHQNGTFNTELQPPQHQQDQEVNFGSQPEDDHQTENNKGVEFSTWNANNNHMNNNDLNQMKWMPSKMRVKLKMKKSNDHHESYREVVKHVDHEEISYNNNPNTCIPVRVCSDCNTTKTPLWRSGPQGPKSLCNACGIRQRKARRAMAAATAAAEDKGNNNSNLFIDQLKIRKPSHKKPHNKSEVHPKYKKRQFCSKQITPPSSPSLSSSPPRARKKNCVEEYLVSLSKNLSTLYHLFPQDEKEAAILLMALSCGYAHQT